MKVTMAALPATARRSVASVASALVVVGAVAASVALTTPPPATWLAAGMVSPNYIQLSAHGDGGGIYKHLWLDAIGPQVHVRHVDTRAHQSH